MDESKKKIVVIAACVAVAIAGASFLMTRGGVGGQKEEVVGSLEGGKNNATGLPLDPVKPK
jgi:hypothetical protein